MKQAFHGAVSDCHAWILKRKPLWVIVKSFWFETADKFGFRLQRQPTLPNLL